MSDNYAMDTAARFGEIPFAEFTRDLITDTFQALLDADLQQLRAYTDTVTQLSQDLSTYINNTHDDISIAELQTFVNSLNLPDPAETQNLINAVSQAWSTFQPGGTTPTTAPSGTLSAGGVGALLGALPGLAQSVMGLVAGGGSSPSAVTLGTNTTLSSPTNVFGQTFSGTVPNYQLIYKAIAGKISNDKYSLLQNMVRMGMTRLVVESGNIETRITFNTYESASNTTTTKTRDRVRTRANGSLLSKLIGNKERTRHVTVTTAKAEHRDAQGSSVQIFGRVQLNFKTDYLPLAGNNQ